MRRRSTGVCVVIAGLFVEVMLETALDVARQCPVRRGNVRSALLIGLTFFLREVHRAMRTVRFAVGRDK